VSCARDLTPSRGGGGRNRHGVCLKAKLPEGGKGERGGGEGKVVPLLEIPSLYLDILKGEKEREKKGRRVGFAGSIEIDAAAQVGGGGGKKKDQCNFPHDEVG